MSWGSTDADPACESDSDSPLVTEGEVFEGAVELCSASKTSVDARMTSVDEAGGSGSGLAVAMATGAQKKAAEVSVAATA